MKRTVALGIQDFEKLRTNHCFYVDKTSFIQDWWNQKDDVTVITRPRRFGKTLTMSMLNCFFSNKYMNRENLFEDLSIWKDISFRSLQGLYPVMFITFADIKPNTYRAFLGHMKICINRLYSQHDDLLESDCLTESDRSFFHKVQNWDTSADQGIDLTENDLKISLYRLSAYMEKRYKKKVIILLDEYDTPMQEAYVNGYWDQIVSFMENLFNTSFKTNPHIQRVLMTGITRISKESIFSDFNNVEVITTTSEKYESAFGFTEQEVFAALDEQGLSNKKDDVKKWYDGFRFGNTSDIYNPWSIINYLQKHTFAAYWANTSSNELVSRLIQESNPEVKKQMELLLSGQELKTEMDEQIVFSQLDRKKGAIWSLLVASGYLKISDIEQKTDGDTLYILKTTNQEVDLMFRNMIKDWFADSEIYNAFVKALLRGDTEEMEAYLNELSLEVFSCFDTGNRPSKKQQPERFYHGFVLGLLVELRGRYQLSSNQESGLGRYDVSLIPIKNNNDPAIILEFKVFNPKKEKTLEDTVTSALKQIREKAYDKNLLSRGIAPTRIRHYALAFHGKEVLIGSEYNFKKSNL